MYVLISGDMVSSEAFTSKVVFVCVRRNLRLQHHIDTLKSDVGAIVKEPYAGAEILNGPYDTVFHPDIEKPFSKLPFPSLKMGVPTFTH